MIKKFTFLLACSVFSAVTLFAQSSDEKEIAGAVEKLRKAMISADKKTLEDLTAPELSYGHSSGLVEDKAAFVDQFVKKTTVFVTISLTDQTIRVVGNTAIVRHKLAGDTNNNNVPGKANISVLLVWQKQQGQWKLLARQATKI